MLMNNTTQTLVGADLSRTPPIYRPSLAITISPATLLFAIFTHIADYALSKKPDICKGHRLVMLSATKHLDPANEILR
jgi:hypothetical protein